MKLKYRKFNSKNTRKRKYRQKINKRKRKAKTMKGGTSAKCHPKISQNLNHSNNGYTSCIDKQTIDLMKKRNKINKIDSCSEDNCILRAIKDDYLKERIKKFFYAPEAPDSWKKDSTKWLTNIDLEKVMRQYEEAYDDFKFISVSPIDFDSKKYDTCVTPKICMFNICDYLKKKDEKIKKFGFIFNTDKHTQSGSHWISLFIDINRKLILYFDSAGEKIPTEIRTFVKRIQKDCKKCGLKLDFDSNEYIKHQKTTTECGMYCLFFIINMLTGNMTFSQFKDKNNLITDPIVFNKRGEYFNNTLS